MSLRPAPRVERADAPARGPERTGAFLATPAFFAVARLAAGADPAAFFAPVRLAAAVPAAFFAPVRLAAAAVLAAFFAPVRLAAAAVLAAFFAPVRLAAAAVLAEEPRFAGAAAVEPRREPAVRSAWPVAALPAAAAAANRSATRAA
ncbi:MAG: hypothetical protein M0013_00425, partial [Actinomycetota bacterium]|nr:hypothetical protein [Actinomycetota bacterium]